MQAFGRPALEKVLDLVSAVNGRAVPDKNNLAGDLASEPAQEAHHYFGIIGSGMHLPEQAPIGGDAADRRKMIARQFDAQQGRLPARRPVAHGHQHEVKGRLIPLFRHFLVCTMVTLDYRLPPHG